MKLKKILLLPIGLVLGIAGCANMPFSTYNMTTTSFNYDPYYSDNNLQLNGVEIGGGFGRAIATGTIKVGPQIITWGESNSKKKHKATNEVIIHRDQLKGKKYIALHIYPDDTVEVITSNHWPDPTEKGLIWLEKLRQEQKSKR